MSGSARNPRLTVRDFEKLAADGVPIAMLTAYDATSARLAEAVGVPAVLVGDSLGMVVQGHETPIPVTLDHMIYHSAIVVRMTRTPLVIADLPFMTAAISPERALDNAARLMQQGGAGAVKLEGGEALAPTIARIVGAGIPVMAHIGLMPQSVHKVGGMRVQGRDLDAARALLRDAEAVQAAGAFSVVLEAVPAPLAALITERLHIPTIGIGAGAGCDGQVQVFHDLLGLGGDFVPRHAHVYTNAGEAMQAALAQYVDDVRARRFPTDENAFRMKDEVLAALVGGEHGDGAGAAVRAETRPAENPVQP